MKTIKLLFRAGSFLLTIPFYLLVGMVEGLFNGFKEWYTDLSQLADIWNP